MVLAEEEGVDVACVAVVVDCLWTGKTTAAGFEQAEDKSKIDARIKYFFTDIIL